MWFLAGWFMVLRPFLKRSSLLSRIVFFSALAFTLFMALIPPKADPTVFINDKIKHALVFFFLAFILDFAYYNKRLVAKFLGLVFYGFLIELCQYFTHYRDFSILDIVADIFGIGAYFLLSPLWIRQLGSSSLN